MPPPTPPNEPTDETTNDETTNVAPADGEGRAPNVAPVAGEGQAPNVAPPTMSNKQHKTRGRPRTRCATAPVATNATIAQNNVAAKKVASKKTVVAPNAPTASSSKQTTAANASSSKRVVAPKGKQVTKKAANTTNQAQPSIPSLAQDISVPSLLNHLVSLNNIWIEARKNRVINESQEGADSTNGYETLIQTQINNLRKVLLLLKQAKLKGMSQMQLMKGMSQMRLMKPGRKEVDLDLKIQVGEMQPNIEEIKCHMTGVQHMGRTVWVVL
ncbi:hypothetical protein SESBI_04129 [Sesbania bispinosa]|nr:hypothetical protein SESBI_04129 [Sesbania bispinosa]